MPTASPSILHQNISTAYLVPLSYAIVGLVNLLPLGHVVAAVETGELGEPGLHRLSAIGIAERVADRAT